MRQGKPKGIKDGDDLVKPGISVIAPHPTTSGGARWNDLATGEFANRKDGSHARAKKARPFSKGQLFRIDEALGRGAQADQEHVADGGSLDPINSRK